MYFEYLTAYKENELDLVLERGPEDVLQSKWQFEKATYKGQEGFI